MADTPYKKARRRADHIFRDLLPRYGLAVREGQLALCQQMLNALFFNKIILCDAGVGIGKTHAYLVACLLWRQYGPFFENHPITISTSSISLQEAIVRDYLPRLSDILLRHGILDRPLNVVIRKGKQHFVCDMRLAERQAQLAEGGRSSRLRLLNQCTRHYDLDAVPGLSGYDRRLICVPVSCPKTCEGYGICQYHQFVRGSMNDAVDIQICNHNYLLADASHRLNGQRPLLQDCGVLIVDEAHKLPEAARQMDSFSLSLQDIFALTDLLEKDRLTIHAQRLRDCARSLWNALEQQPEWNGQASVQPLIAELETTLRNFRRELSPGMMYRLEETLRQFSVFAQRDPRYVLYIQRTRKGGLLLCAVSRSTPLRLERAFWAQGVPAILTSGTLAAGGSFAHTPAGHGTDRVRTRYDLYRRFPVRLRAELPALLSQSGTSRGRNRLAGRTNQPAGTGHARPHAGAVHLLPPDGCGPSPVIQSTAISLFAGVAGWAAGGAAVQGAAQRSAVCGGALLGGGGLPRRLCFLADPAPPAVPCAGRGQ